MNDIKKVLIVAICVVLVIAIAAGVSIGVMANTMNGLKDKVAELDQAYASDMAAMKAEIEAAKAANENLVTAADFEAKLAAAIGEQNQTMQSLISTAVKNQIEDLEVEGLTEEQVNAIIDAAVANCLTEADIDAIVAGIDSGLSKDEVKKIVADYTAGTLTYGQIVNLIEDESYSLRKFLEDTLKAYTDALGERLDGELGDLNETVAGKTAKITVDAADVTGDTLKLADVLDNLLDGGKVVVKGNWSDKTLEITCTTEKDFIIDISGVAIDTLDIYAPLSHIELWADGAAWNNLFAVTAPDSLVITGSFAGKNVTIDSGRVVIGEEGTVENVNIGGSDAKLENEGVVTNVTIENGASNATVTNNGTVSNVTIENEATDATVTNNGTISGDVNVNGEGATINNTEDATIKGDVTVNGTGAAVNNEGVAGSIVVESEDAEIENSGTVEEVTGSNYVTYDPETDGDLEAFIEGAADGAIIYVPENEYTITQIDIKSKSVTVIGIGDVTFNALNGQTRVFNIYGTHKDIEENKTSIDVTITNITLAGEIARGGIWVRTYGAKGTVNLTLKNVTCLADGYTSLQLDNNYDDGSVVNVVMEGCAFNTVRAEASPFNNNGINTYTNVKYDETTEIETLVVPNEVENLKNVTINGEVADNTTYVFTADALVKALEAGSSVTLANDIVINPANMSNAYGKTGINVKKGQDIDGNGYIINIKGAGGTWDSGINTTGGTIENITVTGSFRGIFINHNSDYSERVILNNVTLNGTTYTISCDQGLKQGLTATDSTFNGWTSYAATIGDVEFVDCSFGKGNGYAFCRPYAPTTFTGCEFEKGFKVDPRAAVVFENCYLDGVLITADNLSDLVTSNIGNASVK